MKSKNFKKHIGLLTSSFLPSLGGVEIGLHNLSKKMILKGYYPIIFTSWKHKSNLDKLNINLPYKVISFPPKFLYLINICPSFFLYLNNLILRFWKWKYKIDIWHGTFCHPIGTLLGYHNLKTKNKFVLRAVGEDIQLMPEINYGMRLNSIVDNLIKKYIHQSEYLIATTETVRQEYLKLGIKKKKIKQISNGIDLKYLQSHKTSLNFKKKLGINKNHFIFLSLGRYHEKKNFLSVIKASKILKTNGFKNFSLIIAGRGNSILNNEIKKLNAEDIVKIYETRNLKGLNRDLLDLPSRDILDLYSISDCFIMPSLIETFGIVTIEAMAFGLPIIISNSKGNIDVVRNGKDGILFDNDFHGNNLAIEMTKILTDCKQYKKFKAKSLARVKKFDWSDIVVNYCDLYDNVLELKK